jgi:hypothetical protein
VTLASLAVAGVPPCTDLINAPPAAARTWLLEQCPDSTESRLGETGHVRATTEHSSSCEHENR